MKNCIICGPDAVGKSTLASLLAKKLNYSILPVKAVLEDSAYYLNLLESGGHIFDRFHLSELIFPKIYKRDSNLDFNAAMEINKKIVENNDLFVILFSSDLTILKDRFIERKEFKYLDEVEAQYEEYLKWIYVFNAYFDGYSNYRVFDIADPDYCIKLYSWLDERLEQKK